METDSPEEQNYIFDPENAAEMVRLINQDRLLTRNMGGPLVGALDDGSSLQTILDVACGAGGWVLDVAFALPDAEIFGVDISEMMISYANARARSQKLSNASFGIMNITHPLDFSASSFDLVNARFLTGVLRREQWSVLIAECTRILRPGGTLRVTEFSDTGISTSPASERLSTLVHQAMWKAGYGFSPFPEGQNLRVTTVLPHLLRSVGYQNVRHLSHALEYSLGTEAWPDLYHGSQVIGQQAKRLLVSAGVATVEEVEQLATQMLIEMNAEDFCGMWSYITVLGQKPSLDQSEVSDAAGLNVSGASQ